MFFVNNKNIFKIVFSELSISKDIQNIFIFKVIKKLRLHKPFNLCLFYFYLLLNFFIYF